jgi:hypothetical protein
MVMKRLVSGSLFRAGAAWLVLMALSIVYRLPALIHARGLNSDVAVVGLQALHFLGKGELSPFLWGSGYQSAADSLVAAFWFTLLGPSPFALVFSALSLHLLVTSLVFVMLCRSRVSIPRASALTALLVFASASVHSYALNPPREASIALVFCSLFLAAPKALPLSRRRLWAALLCFGLSLAADPYARLMAPACLLLIAYAAGTDARARLKRLPELSAVLALSFVPDFLLRHSAHARSGPMSFDLSLVRHNADLFTRVCAPWALGAQSYAAVHVMDFERTQPSSALGLLQGCGVIAYGVLFLVSLLALYRSAPRERALAASALLTLILTVLGFMISVMVMDLFAMRYLATLTLFAPFAFVPAVQFLPKRIGVVLLLLHCAGTAISGWQAFAPYTDGAHIASSPEGARVAEDEALLANLQSRGVKVATADYWASYRLSFLFKEQVIVVPTNAAEDRYALHRAAFDREKNVAYIHDRGRSRESLAAAEVAAALKIPANTKVSIGPYTVFYPEQ